MQIRPTFPIIMVLNGSDAGQKIGIISLYAIEDNIYRSCVYPSKNIYILHYSDDSEQDC